MSPAEWMAIAMLVTVLIGIFKGYPVAFTLAGVSLIFAGIGYATGVISLRKLGFADDRVYGLMSNEILLAIPYFIFMGTMLEKSKLAESLLLTIGQLFGSVRGGLALAVVFVGAMLAAATGVVGASVVAMGMISLPVMLKNNYSKHLATGVVAASGTLGQIIPPSIVLIVLADQMGTSIGKLFQGALIPGLLLAGMYALYCLVLSYVNKDAAPALSADQRPDNVTQLVLRVIFVLLPPLGLILLVLGSIFTGIASPTEAGSLGAVGAVILGFIYSCFLPELKFGQAIKETVYTTGKICCMIMFLLVGSAFFILVLRAFSGHEMITELLANLPGGKVSALVLIMLVIFVLGFFIDFFEICFIVVPLVTPVLVERFGVNPTWLGVLIAMNLQTSFLTPPFGFSLFYLKGVCPPEVKTRDIYRGVLPFIVIQFIGLILICVFPEIVLWLVGVMGD